MNTQEWLAKLVSFDTTSHHSNLALIDTIDEWLTKYHITSTKTYNKNGDKANLFATIPAQGPTQHGLILSGHTDVVPVTNQTWSSHPFTARFSDDRVYGRGTADMKGFIAVILALIPTFTSATLKFPVHLAFSYDEEVGCLGAPHLISAFQQQGIQPWGCIVGEPTEMQVVIAHKGMNVYQCELHGKAAHSSLTSLGCNAIDYAADLIQWIRQLAKQLKQSGPWDEDFDIPFTTITTNVVQGGSATNIIPSYCEFKFEFRNLPNINPEDIIANIQHYITEKLLPSMQQEYENANITLTQLGAIPSFRTSNKVELINQLINYSTKKVSYATEAGLFERAGIPTIICGPGSIQQAHKVDEFIAISELTKCEAFLREVCVG